MRCSVPGSFGLKSQPFAGGTQVELTRDGSFVVWLQQQQLAEPILLGNVLEEIIE